MAIALLVLYLVFTLIVLYQRMKAYVWEIGTVTYLILALSWLGLPWWGLSLVIWAAIILAVIIIHVEPIRLAISDYFYENAKQSIPKLSKTEEEALNAGDTWLEQDIFVGSPNWQRLASCSSELTKEEQAFLSNEVQTLCGMLDDWQIKLAGDLPEEVWAYLKEKGFFGLVIAKEYGGKGFSARAHSEVVMKIATRSPATAVTVMVPNSLGPGELITYYGTPEQKEKFLPNLAKGIDIPCFALTEPSAGSDATSIQAEAVVVKKEIDNQEILGLNLTINKRYITLAPVATLIGLAVHLKDPNHLLNGEGGEGITCILIPRNTDNLQIGNRHLPAEQSFMNGTVRGENIFVPISTIIGGQKNAGRGWQMLVECLSIGRSISLPALGAASASVIYLTSSAYARIRRQFNVEIGQFEGIEEKLAEIGGLSYLIHATRLLTVAAVNQHKKPSVASAISKYFNTELGRIIINHGMDIHAGRGLVIGPRNYLFNYYQSAPVTITVEGANIMSRNLLIFGQGAIACHPYIRDEFYAISHENKQAFHRLIWLHIHYSLGNFVRAFCSAWTGGIFIFTPNNPLRKKYKTLTRLSHAFAWIADLSLIYLGGDLKRKERLSARLADAMSYLYMAMATLHRFQQQGNHPDEQIHAEWAVQYCLSNAQKSMIQFIRNFPSLPFRFLMQLFAFPLGQSIHYPNDKLEHHLAQLMQKNNYYRLQLKNTSYLSNDPKQPVDRMEHAMQLIIQHDVLYKKIPGIRRFKFNALKNKLNEKVVQGELSQQEMDQMIEVERACWDAIQVDEFSLASCKDKTFVSLTDQ